MPIDMLLQDRPHPAGVSQVVGGAPQVVGGAPQQVVGACGASEIVGACGELLRCVWTSHPDHTRDCRACIPAAAVARAWQRERDDYGTPEGFFFFAWAERVWLAYGLRDGRVRGVYCPQHCTARTVSLLRLAQPDRLIL